MSETAAAEHYTKNVASMQNRAWFYDGIEAIWNRCAIPLDAAICDIGSGTGALLARLANQGYKHLSGSDFALGCVEATLQVVPAACVFVHDIEREPLPTQQDVILLTGVIDFVADPSAALRHIKASLNPQGRLILHIRNRLAYWPWYHLRSLAPHIKSKRLRHWFLWFTTPLGMRRADQPFEKVYAPAEMRALLIASGLQPVATHGFHCLPMVWIPELSGWMRLMRQFDRLAQRFLPKNCFYHYVFVCRSAE